eukprot:5403133-Pyramimonas_sp.AAC.1
MCLGRPERSPAQDSPYLLEDPKGQQQLNYECSLWVTAMEETLLGLETHPDPLSRGRRKGFSMGRERSKPTPGRAHLRDDPAE